MTFSFARRIQHAPASFLGELFRVSADPSIISFAGGLPSSALIDAEGLSDAARDVFATDPRTALQVLDDRRLPAAAGIHRGTVPPAARGPRDRRRDPDHQRIAAVPRPLREDLPERRRPGGGGAAGYLGAIEAFSLYEPVFETVRLDSEGPDPGAFEKMLMERPVKFFYGIPNSQNPSGCTYSPGRRREIEGILDGTDTVFYEDDAFGELFFDGKARLPLKRLLPGQAVISGSFSKITAPGMRIGWMYAPQEILTAFNTAKQAADLHSNFLCQQILHRYLTTHDLDAHIQKIVAVYGRQCRLMCDLFDDLMPSLSHTTPEGGMFLTATLPAGLHAMKVFEEGVRQKVAVLPGMPFFVDGGGTGMIRLNFSNADEEKISEGMHRLAGVIKRLS